MDKFFTALLQMTNAKKKRKKEISDKSVRKRNGKMYQTAKEALEIALCSNNYVTRESS